MEAIKDIRLVGGGVLEEKLVVIADAIRQNNGGTELLSLDEIANFIASSSSNSEMKAFSSCFSSGTNYNTKTTTHTYTFPQPFDNTDYKVDFNYITYYMGSGTVHNAIINQPNTIGTTNIYFEFGDPIKNTSSVQVQFINNYSNYTSGKCMYFYSFCAHD